MPDLFQVEREDIAHVRCPCGLGLTYLECCARLHVDKVPAATAEQLMRSRFTAFVLGLEVYLLRSWHPSTRPARLEELEPLLEPTQLKILSTTGGGLLHAEGIVEFEARLRLNGRLKVLHERSRFVRHEGRWFYLDALPVPSGPG